MNSAARMKKLQRVVRAVLVREKRAEFSAHVVCVSEKKIQELNNVYRRKDKPTDVLSFNESGEKKYLGEIVLCLPYIRRQAHAYEVSFEEEVVRMTIHGTLHLLGYDHVKPGDRKKMLPRQELYVNTIRTR